MSVIEKIPLAVEMRNITKSFCNGKIVANHDINIGIEQGEIHAICGGNGAGKSVLMSILFGIYKQDVGEILINGKQERITNAKVASNLGIGMVHQHFKLVKKFSLFQNIILGCEPVSRFGFIKKSEAREKIQEICQKYDLHVDLDMSTNLASVGQQQRAEIIKLLYRDAKILIFDEPTAVLSDVEVDAFLKMLLKLKKDGRTIIFISHKLNEVKKVADRITILRQGTTIKTANADELSKKEIVELMVGKKFVPLEHAKDYSDRSKPVLSVKDLVVSRQDDAHLFAVNNLSFDVCAGEILGIAGIEGNGQTELVLALAGLHKIKSGGIFFYNYGHPVNITHAKAKEISKLGINVVHEERNLYGGFYDETVAYNLICNQLDANQFNRCGFLRKKEMNLKAINLCTKFKIAGANRGKSILRSLSGGNQQKVVVAREMEKPHSLLVLAQPTRGLDIEAIKFMHEQIIEEAKKGVAVILISYDVDEILEVSSRVIVINQGKNVFTAPTKELNSHIIGDKIMRAA